MKRYLLYITAVMVVLSAGVYADAQDEMSEAMQKEEAVQGQDTQQSAVMPEPVSTPVKEGAAKMEELSIYGEVQNVNVQAGSIMVQFYDYDNDEEKSTDIILDGNSKLENVKAIGDIKKGDWVDVTYVVSNGKNMAKIVSVEKEEPAEEESAPAIEE